MNRLVPILSLVIALTATALRAEPLTVYWFRGSRGTLAQPECLSAGAVRGLPWAAKAALLASQRSPEPRVVLDQGPAFGTDPYLGYLLGRAEDGATALTDLLSVFAPDLLLPGREDFLLDDPSRGTVRRRAVEAAHLVFRAVNVHCTRPGLCDSLVDQPWVWSGPTARVAFVPLLYQKVEGVVSSEALEGVVVDPVTPDLVQRVVAGLHAKGVERVVLLARIADVPDANERLTDLLEEVSGVDLVLTDGGSGATLTAADREGRVRVVNLSASPAGALRVRLDVLRGLSVLAVEPLAMPAGAGPQPPLAEPFCHEWNTPLTDVVPEPSFWAPEGFVRYLLDVLRARTDCELTLINRKAVRTEYLRGLDFTGLRRGVLYAALPFDDPVRVARVPGASLGPLLKRALAADGPEGFRVAGAAVQDGNVLVNGRKLDEKRLYRVVMNGFLWEGGDDLVGSSFRESAASVEEGPSVRDLLLEFLEREGWESLSDGRLAPESLHDWSARPLITMRAAAGVLVNSTTTSNRAGYTESQLTLGDLIQVGETAEATLNVENLSQRLRNFLSARYFKTGAALGELKKVEDQAVLDNTYELLAFRQWLWQAPSWMLPSPFVRSRLETEFERSPGVPYHHLQWTGSTGFTWDLVKPFTVFLGYAATRELLDSQGRFQHGLTLSYVLDSWVLYRQGPRKIELVSRFDGTLAGLESTAWFRGIGSSALNLTLIGPLNMNVRYDFFVFRRSGELWGYSHVASLGLSIEMQHVRQAH